jgi:3-oxoacyl-[acyl-carrier protein] reductase
MSDEQFDRVLNVNLRGNFLMTKAVIPYMMEQKYGKIVHLSSVSAYNGNFGQTNYAASKAAIMGMTRVQGKDSVNTASMSMPSRRLHHDRHVCRGARGC